MRSKTLISTIALTGMLAASLSTSAHADGGWRGGHGGHGGHHGGRGGNNGAAVVAGVLGALVVGSIIANAASAPSYAPPQAYYPPAAPAYYEAPRPYYQPAPQAYYPAQPAAVVVDDGYGRRYYREPRQQGYYGY
jgi:hypothetical protein